jgi:hypothetical protein
MDQENLEALLQTANSNNEPIILGDEMGDWGLKMGRWELLKSKDKQWQLYNIKKDPQKKNDLSKKMYRQVNDLVKLYEYWQSVNIKI